MYSIGELRPGYAIVLDGEPYVIVAAQHSKQARQGGVTKTKIKNLVTGSVTNKTFQGNDKLEPAHVTSSKCQYLYKDSEAYHFMNNESYEQFGISVEDIDEMGNFMAEGIDVDVKYFEGKAIGVELPPKVVLEVTHTDPGVKGDTASGGTKPATLETGYVVSVPLFINIGDKIRVNTDLGTYVERA